MQKSWKERPGVGLTVTTHPLSFIEPRNFKILCAHLKSESQIEIEKIRRRIFWGIDCALEIPPTCRHPSELHLGTLEDL